MKNMILFLPSPTLVLALAVVLSAASHTSAQMTLYSYQGSPFTVVNNNDGVTTSNSVSGSFSVFSPLSVGTTSVSPGAIASFNFTDGVHSFTTPSTTSVTVNDSGNISNWGIRAFSTITGGYTIEWLSYNPPNAIGDETTWYTSEANQGGWAYNTTPGIWITSAIPEPSAYAAIFGLTALGFVAYRRRCRKAV